VLEYPQGAAGSPAEDVAVTSAALGAWTERYYAEDSAPVLSLSPQYAIFGGGITDLCNPEARDVDIVIPSTGQVTDVPPLPNVPACGARIATAFGSGDAILVADSLGKRIFRLILTPQFTLAWQVIASTPGAGITKLLASSSHVYWGDATGIYRAPLGGGARTTLAASPDAHLLALDGNVLYIDRYNRDQENWTLQRMPVAGGPVTLLRTRSARFRPDFTFDATHFYFANNGLNGTNHLYKLTKSGLTLTTFRSSTTVTYSHPVVSAGHLYWMERAGVGDYSLERVHLTEGNDRDISVPLFDVSRFAVALDYLYVAGREEDEPRKPILFRGQL
jgi:hypothetical protein